MKLISQEWNDMTDNEKRPYSMMNERLKNQYTADLKDYKASLPPVLKRPKNAYMVFYQDFIKNQHRSGEPMKITQVGASTKLYPALPRQCRDTLKTHIYKHT